MALRFIKNAVKPTCHLNWTSSCPLDTDPNETTCTEESHVVTRVLRLTLLDRPAAPRLLSALFRDIEKKHKARLLREILV